MWNVTLNYRRFKLPMKLKIIAAYLKGFIEIYFFVLCNEESVDNMGYATGTVLIKTKMFRFYLKVHMK